MPGLFYILLFWLIGNALSILTGGYVSGNIIGMILLFAALCLHWVKAETVRPAARFLLGAMALFFVPYGVGLMDSYRVILDNLWAIVISGIASTIIVLLVTGQTFQSLNRRSRLRRIRHVALDMDGTIYMGMSLFPYTKPFLAGLKEMGIGYSFLTNNPSKSIADYLHKLDVLGIHATREEMYTTALATIDYIREHYPAAKRLFLLGTPSMISEFEAAGFESAADSADDVPDVVVAAFDMTLQYDRLCRAAWWVSQGVPYIATNPDRVCPTDQPTVLVDCGSICACIEHATGRRPDITLGKPDPNMLSGILSRHGLQPDQIAMVGDRIYTDVAMAHNAKAMGVLVLSGETTLDVADKADPQPHITADSIEVLGALIREAHSK